ncbi:chain length determination protein [Pasteurellaceae bacterium Orientalotternb1]|nr:chain length determination protein [Pasteurellaceae bacterium Orientalotternb1]
MRELVENKSQDDEIDLVELIKVLWNKKGWIVLSTFVCTLLAGVYAFTAKEQWTSKAEIIGPQITDLDNYLSLRKEYARILGTEFDLNALANGLYGKFERLAYSLDEREAFLVNSEVYKQLSAGKDEAFKRSLSSTLARENISIIKPDPKKQSDAIGRQYTFSAETASLAQDTLKGFITYINQKAFELDRNEFVLLANEKVQDLKFEYERIKQDLVIQRSIQLENLDKALSIATKAGIKEYSKVFDSSVSGAVQRLAISDTKVPLSESKLSDGVYLFMLGEKYLQAQIETANQKGIVYPPRFYQIKEILRELSPLLEKIKTAKATSFSYLSSPDYPIVKDKPKKGMILMIGAILGLIFSMLVILVFNILRKEQND